MNKDKTKRKYFTEFGLHMLGNYKVILQQNGLKSITKSTEFANYPCHIYMIGRRPRIMIDPKSVKFEDQWVTGTFLIQKGLELESYKFEIPNLMKKKRLQFRCPYPHTEYSIFDYGGNLVSRGKTALVLAASKRYSEFLSLEILYIGQSYGTDGKRTAPERLSNHSTLQNIYAEALRKYPDSDIWIVLWNFEPMIFTSVDGRKSAVIETSLDEDDDHIKKVSRSNIKEQQWINFTEAALIRYFQPAFNIEYKNSFPNPAHSTYSTCYEIEINSVSVELQTEDISTQLWSPTVSPKWIHIAQFNLHSVNERKGMFDFYFPITF